MNMSLWRAPKVFIFSKKVQYLTSRHNDVRLKGPIPSLKN